MEDIERQLGDAYRKFDEAEEEYKRLSKIYEASQKPVTLTVSDLKEIKDRIFRLEQAAYGATETYQNEARRMRLDTIARTIGEDAS